MSQDFSGLPQTDEEPAKIGKACSGLPFLGSTCFWISLTICSSLPAKCGCKFSRSHADWKSVALLSTGSPCRMSLAVTFLVQVLSFTLELWSQEHSCLFTVQLTDYTQGWLPLGCPFFNIMYVIKYTSAHVSRMLTAGLVTERSGCASVTSLPGFVVKSGGLCELPWCPNLARGGVHVSTGGPLVRPQWTERHLGWPGAGSPEHKQNIWLAGMLALDLN